MASRTCQHEMLYLELISIIHFNGNIISLMGNNIPIEFTGAGNMLKATMLKLSPEKSVIYIPKRFPVHIYPTQMCIVCIWIAYTHCRLVTAYGDIVLRQPQLRWRLVTWRYQATIQRLPKLMYSIMCLTIILMKLMPNIPRANAIYGSF